MKAEPSSASDEAFEEFWRQYPRRAGKKGARSVYDRIVGKGEATAAELLAGAMRYAAHRTGQDERYTKHPSTWLHQGCWLDEAPRPAWQPGDSAPSGEDLQRQFASDRNRAEYGIRPQQMSNVEIALAGLRRKDQ